MTTIPLTAVTIEQIAGLCDQVIQEVEKAVVGKRTALNMMMAAFLSSGGHILLEDFPGLAKTLIANSFADRAGAGFPAHPVYPGPAAGGYYGRVCF